MHRIFVVFVMVTTLCAQTWMDRMTADPARPNFKAALGAGVPSPETVTGYAIGSRYGMTHELQAYAAAVASASPRAKVSRYGNSTLGRPLEVVVVTSPRNHARMDAVLAANRRIMRGDAIPDDHPVVVFLIAGIHGDEGTAAEGLLGLLHFLAADTTSETESLLERVVVVMDFAQNPDGRDRFAVASRDREGPRPDTDPRSYDHAQAWHTGRTSRDGFDLNRDWFLATHVETRARLDLVDRWSPQIVADLHEMPSDESYFTSTPPCPPVNEYCSDEVKAMWEIVGGSVERHFAARNAVSFDGALYPLDYPGYGGSYNCMRGSAGMTYEQANPRGRAVRRNDGSILSLADAALNHAVASVATVRASAERRDEILKTWAEHFSVQKTRSRSDKLPVFLFPPTTDAFIDREFRDLLMRNRIEAVVLDSAVTLDVSDLHGKIGETRTFPKGTVVVSTDQPLRPLVKTLLDPLVTMEPGFKAEETKRFLEGKPSRVYDVTAWNIPLMFGVPGWRAQSPPAVPTAALRVSDAKRPPATLDASTQALVVAGDGFSAARLVASWLESGLKVRVASRPFTIGERAFDAGAFVALTERNGLEALRRASETAGDHGVEVVAVGTLKATKGPGLGTSEFVPITNPRVALPFGAPFEIGSAGSMRRFLQQSLGIGASALAAERGGSAALRDIDVLVLPDGDADAVAKWIAERDVAGFMDRGGRVVAVKGSAEALRAVVPKAIEPCTLPDHKQALQGPLLGLSSPQGRTWISWGTSDAPVVQARVRRLWSAASDSHVLLAFSDAEALSGELPAQKRDVVRGKTFAAAIGFGAGGMVLFADDPAWRAASPGLWRTLANAVLLAPAFAK